MDVQVRFWNDATGEVQTRYLDSRFFNRPNADNITGEILSVGVITCSKNDNAVY